MVKQEEDTFVFIFNYVEKNIYNFNYGNTALIRFIDVHFLVFDLLFHTYKLVDIDNAPIPCSSNNP